MIVETDWIDGMVCADCCAEGALTTFAPGDDGAFGPGNILIARATPARGWCLACAYRRGWLQQQQVNDAEETR